MRTLRRGVARNVLVFMTDSADGKSGKTGLTLTIQASKAGGVFSVITPTVTERISGWYQLALTANHIDTLGDFALNITAPGADPSDILMDVVSHDLTAIGSNAFIAADLVIEQVTSQTVFILTGGPANDIASVMVIIKDTSASGAQVIAEGSYVGGTRTLTLTAATAITVTSSDTITMVAMVAASNSVSIMTGGITSDSFALAAINAAAMANDAISANVLSAAAVAKILAGGDIDGTTLEQALKIITAVLAGKVTVATSGVTTTVTFRAIDDSKARVTATTDTSANRTAVTIDSAG